MLATLEMIEILDETDQLVKMILQSDVAEHYRTCLYTLKNNQDSQKKIQDFIRMKDQYEEVQRFGRYHPDYKTVMQSIRDIKRTMDLDEHVTNFKRAETDLQTLLDEVSLIIGHSVSKQIKVPTGNPFFDSSCSGGCGTGGSCAC